MPIGSPDRDRLVAQAAVEHFGPATERAMKMMVKHLFVGVDRSSDTIDTSGMLATMAVEDKSIPTAVLENFGVASAVEACHAVLEILGHDDRWTEAHRGLLHRPT